MPSRVTPGRRIRHRRDRPGRRDSGRGGVRTAPDQARDATASLKVADGRITAAALAGSGW
ncbi:hypothetical protein GCM10017667_48090 [Streptomyces filamentosus]|uniref:Uncharacterized protein n=1 Tax=Streptomyces filamentosus TaxID=67294 RepID=A0A919BTV5_STRFL|nr:hypothetical protein GCM10017667_48090 [Streptomyces filamentosus]